MLLAAGCDDDGPSMVPAGGKVLYNGEPLDGANVVFVPEDGGPSSVGQTGADGRFTLSTSAKPGAVIGKHQVAVQAIEGAPSSSTNESGEFEGEHRWLIPKEYGSHFSSGLSAAVTNDGENDFTFELTGGADGRRTAGKR